MGTKRLSSGFAGSTTRSLNLTDLEKEIEYRLSGDLKHLDVFTDDFSPPGATEQVRGADFRKQPQGNKPHDDYSQAEDNSFNHGVEKKMAAAGNAKDQEYLDEIDQSLHDFYSKVKNPSEQFPGAKTLSRLAEGVDETLWKKAKDASQQAFGRIKWPFVNWWYENHGGK